MGVGFIEFWVSREVYYLWSGDGLMDVERELDFLNIYSDEGRIDIFMVGYYFLSLFIEGVFYDEIFELDILRFIRRELYWDFFL